MSKTRDLVKKIVSDNDIKGKTTVLFLGAGSVTKWAHDFYSLLKRVYE